MATKRSRIGHRLLLKMGLRREGTCPTFDLAHENYTWLKHYVEEMRESLSTYALQLARMTEAARGVGDDASHIYLVRDKGFKPVVAFKEAQDKGHNGYAGQLQQAFVKGIIEPISQWHKDLESMEVLVVDFNDIRIQHDHYRLKVEDLTQKAKALEARATTRGDSREAKAAAEKLKRNTAKLNDVTKEFDKRLSLCCDRMTAAWDEREKMMNGIVARIIHFQESFFGEMLMCGLGVSRILRDAEGSGPRWGGTSGIEPFVPKGHIRHYEGELVRKHTLIKERLWYRLVGSSLEVYDVKTKEDEPLYVVTEAPIEVWEVKGIARMSPVNFRVTVLAGPDGGLNLFAADEVDGQGWWEALTRASEWDQLASASKVEAQVSESRAFLKRCKIAHANTTTVVGLEKELGVTEALANPPPPPADRPDAKGYTVAVMSGGGSVAAGGGGGKVVVTEATAAGGSRAAGVAPGGEAGVDAAVIAAAAALKGKGGKGKKGKKGDGDGGEKMPELVNANDKKKGGGGGPGGGPGGLPAGLTGGLGAGGMSGGIGGMFPGRTGRPGMSGMMAGAAAGAAAGVPLGMMGGRGGLMNGPSFSGAGSSFNGSTHSSMSGHGGGGGGGGGGSQMGDPRLRMGPQQMGGMGGGGGGGGGGPPMPGMFNSGPPPVNPSTGLPVGMVQSGPAIMLPPGMLPTGGGPVINPPGPPPSMMDPSMMGGRGPGAGGWGGPPQASSWGAGSGAGVLPQSRSFGSRFGGRKPAGARQQGFRRSNSFGDQYMGPGGAAFPGGRAFDDMMQPGPLSPMMEDDGFDTHSTRSAPAFGATAVVGEAAREAEAAMAASTRVAAGVHDLNDLPKDIGTEETKSSSSGKKKGGGGKGGMDGAGKAAAAAAAGAAAAGVAAAVAASADRRAAPTPPSPPRRVPSPVVIQTVQTKTTEASETGPPTTVSAVSVTTATPAASSGGESVAKEEKVEENTVSVATASKANESVTVATATTSKAAPVPAAPLSPVDLDRGDDGGLSRYGLSGETPARTRSRPTPTWKRMMSLGGSSSSRSYRYDGGDMGVSGEAKPSAEEVFMMRGSSADTSSLKKTRSAGWSLKRSKSNVSNVSPSRGSSISAKPRSGRADASAAAAGAAAAAAGASAGLAVAERKTSSSERRSSSTVRGARSAVRSSGRSSSSSSSSSAAAAASKGPKALSPSEDLVSDDDYKRAPPISRDETALGRTTRTKATKKFATGMLKPKERSGKPRGDAAAATTAAAAAAAGAAAATAVATATTSSGTTTTTARRKSGKRPGVRPSSSSGGGSSSSPSTSPPTVAAGSRQKAAPSAIPEAKKAESPIPGVTTAREMAIKKAGEDSTSAGAPSSTPLPGGGAAADGAKEAPSATVAATIASTVAGTFAASKMSAPAATTASGEDAATKTGVSPASSGSSSSPPTVGGQREAPSATVVAASESPSSGAAPAAPVASAAAPAAPAMTPITTSSAPSSAAPAPSMTPITTPAVPAMASIPAVSSTLSSSSSSSSSSGSDAGDSPTGAAAEASRAPRALGSTGISPKAAVGGSTAVPTAAGAIPAVQEAAAEKLAAEKLAAEKLAAEKLAAEKSAAEKSAAEKAAAEKAAAEKAADEKAAAAAKYAEERKASAEAAKRVDSSTGIMKNLTLEEIMMRSSEADGGGGGGGGGSNFDMVVPAVASTAAAAAAAAGVAAVATGGGDGASDSAARSSADAPSLATPKPTPNATTSTATATADGSGASSPTSVASTRATVGAPTPIIPAKEPRTTTTTKAGGCDSITPALFAALGAATAPSPKKTAGPPAVPEITAAPAKTSSAPAGSSSMVTPRTAASTAATAAAEASSVAVAAAAAAEAAAAVARNEEPTNGGVNGAGAGAGADAGSSKSPAAATSSVVHVPSPDTPGSTGSGAQIAAQAKVFQRLCDSSGSEAETGDAGGGGGAGSPSPTLSFQQLMGWDEVQELLEYGALKEEELTSLWQSAVRAQNAERGVSESSASKGMSIWGSTSTSPSPGTAASSTDGSAGGTKEALTQRGFEILVKLIEELQFEKELEQDKGVGLVPGPVCVV